MEWLLLNEKRSLVLRGCVEEYRIVVRCVEVAYVAVARCVKGYIMGSRSADRAMEWLVGGHRV